MFDSFQGKLMKELEEAEVQARILAIVAHKLGEESARHDKLRMADGKLNKKTDVNCKKRADDESELKKLRLEVVGLRNEAAALKKERDAAKDALESAKESAREKLDAEKQNARMLLNEIDELKKAAITRHKKMYDLYLTLPINLRKSLDGYFHAKDMESFLFCGVQPDNFRNFWDFCRTELARGRLLDQRDNLLAIYEFFFELINSSLGEDPMWMKQPVRLGCEFDAMKFSVASESASIGKVQDVIWPGILYAGNQKVCKKSLVVVQ